MKKITRNKYGAWQEVTDGDNTDFIEVSDDVVVGFLNSPYYTSKNFTNEGYEKAQERFNVTAAKSLLANTDYVAIQWKDEVELGVEHSRSRSEYRAILEQRQEARSIIRGVVDSIS